MRPMQHDRGQAYALEGIIGAVIVVSALVLGLQAVDIAPWTDSDERATEGVRVEVADTLDAAEDSGALSQAVTCLADGEIHPSVASTADPTTEFGRVLNNTLADRYRYQIHVDYVADDRVQTTAVETGNPLPNQPTATVTRQIALYDSDPVYEGETCERRTDFEGETVTLGQLDEDDDDNDNVYLEDRDEDSELFAIVRVRVIAW